ncbi:vesicle-associated membrane protein 7-like isoform X2 [Ursus maritimus]|uniref:Vesicle-associated membrane protein 7-like isoform X2 n=1 Tax=Ursus maritimus TaxID=29073 RepID=A0A8M1FBP7_URSMA|nr:vesicle-associated membrane protein 7-like isoform X2 [Ursus maritimus]XP_057165834.1 vesicle-associated membrane protein 7-like [Ursus arctos]
MTITYSCIANGRAVLAELALTGGSYQEAVATVLKLVLLRAEPKTIMQMGSFVYHTLFIDGITYLCATDNALDTITPSAFLKNAKESQKTRKILRRIWWKHFRKIVVITVVILLSIIIILLSTNVIPT